MTQSVKYLSPKHEDLSSRTLIKQSRVLVQAYNSRIGEPETGRSKNLLDSLPHVEGCGPVREPVSKTRWTPRNAHQCTLLPSTQMLPYAPAQKLEHMQMCVL